jgi:hypothetical protein
VINLFGEKGVEERKKFSSDAWNSLFFLNDSQFKPQNPLSSMKVKAIELTYKFQTPKITA